MFFVFQAAQGQDEKLSLEEMGTMDDGAAQEQSEKAERIRAKVGHEGAGLLFSTVVLHCCSGRVSPRGKLILDFLCCRSE